jgi:hypothetical protein
MADYRIGVTISQLSKGWTCIYSIPSFVYEGDILGIVNEEHAEKIARLTFEQLLPSAGLSITATRVEP